MLCNTYITKHNYMGFYMSIQYIGTFTARKQRSAELDQRLIDFTKIIKEFW